MLHVKPCLSDECEKIYEEVLSGASLPAGIDVGLFSNGDLIGAARVSFGEDKARLEAVCLLPAYRKNGFGDFLTRAVMDAYTRSLPVFEIGYKSDYFLKFGFSESGESMVIESEKIKFPSRCKEAK